MNLFFNKQTSGIFHFRSYMAVILITLGFFFLAQIPLANVVAQAGQSNVLYSPAIQQLMPYPLFFLLINLPFIAGLAALLIFFWLFHRCNPKTIITSANRFRKGMFGWGLFSALIAIFITDLYYYIKDPSNFIWQYSADQFWTFLPFALLIFPLQIGFEEIFFRGYLFQGISRSTRSIMIGWILTSALFGLAHSFNLEIREFGFWKMLLVYITLGMGLGLITILTEGLELALGFHLMNNLYVALIKTFPGSSLDTPALFMSPPPDTQFIIIETIFGILLFIILALAPYLKKIPKQPFSINNRL